jgi:hypothetical protein
MSAAVPTSVVFLTLLCLPSAATAQSPAPPTSAAPQAPAQAAAAPDPDLQVNPAEPEFTLGALPTTLRMPAGKFSFRMTHRFSRPIASGTAGEFFADFVGFDSSARVGLELRYGVRPGTQVTFHRTNDRAIQFLGQQELLRQDAGRPIAIHAVVAVEGADNFSEEFSGTVGAVLSRQFSERGAVYLQPLFVSHTNPETDATENRHTMLLGVGTRIRLGQTRTYVVIEAAPQIAGYDAGIDHISVGIEKRAGGHMFQLTIANALGTTLRQVARGGPHRDDWFIGFNLTRRFF